MSSEAETPARRTSGVSRRPSAGPKGPGPALSGRRHSTLARLSRLGDHAFVVPGLALVGVLLLGSVVYTIVVSFTEWNMVSAPTFVGGANYETMVGDPAIRLSLLNTVLWVVGSLALPVVLGLLIAVFVDLLPLQSLWKTILYLPVVLAPTVSGSIFKQILSYDGPLYQFLEASGIGHPDKALLAIPFWNTITMIITSTWRTVGPAMVMFLIGLQTIPRETVEAAMLDGANAWQVFRRIKLPQIRPITVVVVTMSVIGSFTTFDYVYVMTGGGPYQSSETLAVTIYRLAFGQWKVGYASALAVLLSVITLGFSGYYILRGMQRNPKEAP